MFMSKKALQVLPVVLVVLGLLLNVVADVLTSGREYRRFAGPIGGIMIGLGIGMWAKKRLE
jgi:hypothetical protein